MLIVQSDAFNRSKIATVIAAAITSNTSLAAAPGNVSLSRRASGLPKTSVVNVSQVATLDKSMLTGRVRALSKELMDVVDEGLRLVLGL
jgi:mRNA interferase MazF